MSGARFGWRHLRSVLLLPVVVTIVVPTWILMRSSGATIGWSTALAVRALAVAIGLAFVAAGLSLAVWTIALFATEGDGTLAPWDPPAKLVARGPYRIVRNPMISGVIAILIGETLVSGSRAIAVWTAIVALVNAIYIPLVEEVGLEQRFGESYRDYRRTVPRWTPRL